MALEPTFPREDESPKPVSVQAGSISPILHSKGSHIGGCHPARVAESEVSKSLAQPSAAPPSLNCPPSHPANDEEEDCEFFDNCDDDIYDSGGVYGD